MKLTGTLTLLAILGLAMVAGCKATSETPAPVPPAFGLGKGTPTTGTDNEYLVATLENHVAALGTSVAELAGVVGDCCRGEEGPGDPGGYILDSVESPMRTATPKLNPPAGVALYRVSNMTPDPPGFSHGNDSIYCYTIASRATDGLSGWDAVPIADAAAVANATRVPSAEVTSVAGSVATPRGNPGILKPESSGQYGWYVRPGCYFVKTDRDGVTHTSPVVGVLPGITNDVVDLHFCWANRRWGSDLRTVCTLPTPTP